MNTYSQEKIVKTNKIILELTPSEADFLLRFWGHFAAEDRASTVSNSPQILDDVNIKEQKNLNENFFWDLREEVLKSNESPA